MLHHYALGVSTGSAEAVLGSGSRVRIVGVYGGLIDKFPLGAFFGRGEDGGGSVRRAAVHTDLLHRVLNGDFDTTSLIGHRLTLEEAPHADEVLRQEGELHDSGDPSVAGFFGSRRGSAYVEE